MRKKHANKLILRNKFEFLVEFVKSKVDISMISETKNDESFPLGQFKINGFNTSFCFDRNSSNRGTMLSVRENLLGKTDRL